MSDMPESRRTAARRGSAARNVLWCALALVLLIVFAVAWIGVRGLLARDHLERAVSDVSTLRSQLESGHGSAALSTSRSLEGEADAARRLTGDPVWSAAQLVPFIGPNLRAVRGIAVIVDDVAHDAVVPATRALGAVNEGALTPKSGAIDVSSIKAAQPSVAAATTSLASAARDADAIDTRQTVSVVTDAVGHLRSVLNDVSARADAANRVITLAPEMLGGAGEKHYLVLFQNNAELRAGGGNPGALAYVSVDAGKITLGQQASTAQFPGWAAPVLPLSEDTKGLYGAITGQYMQDVTLTPRFDVSAALAREMWKQKFGSEVDGVVAVDPVTLGYVLRATGPVQLPTGEVLSSDNAAQLLLSEAYSKYPVPAEQDAFFSSAASAVFSRVAAGSFDAKSFIGALTTAADEGRVRVWSANPAERSELAGTAVADQLPESGSGAQRFGVFLNDATGAKMDYYLQKRVSVGSQVCRRDGRPTWVVSVTLTNTAPADAGSTLPPYVTGNADFGVTPGDVRTNVAIYAPASALYLESAQGNGTNAPQTTSDGKYPVTQFQTTLAPGQSVTVKSSFLGPRSASRTAVDAVSTPGLVQSKAEPLAVSCSDPLG